MFRQEEIIFGGWKEKTIESMQKRRFEQLVGQLPPLGAQRLEELPPLVFERRIEHSWQNIERKPMRMQQISAVWQSVLSSIERQADCLSREEHSLVERALILGGGARIEDAVELEAARALSLRLWASVGLVSGKPYIELEMPVLQPVARAFAREEHDVVRKRLDTAYVNLTNQLYRVGAMDDRQPQRMILREALGGEMDNELLGQLSRQYLWASFDCVDYTEGVILVHSALADPAQLFTACRRRSSQMIFAQSGGIGLMDILPEEIPIQERLERAIAGALRNGYDAQEVARNLRYLCKQGAPITALEEILQETLIVHLSPLMKHSLKHMYYALPKWIECPEQSAMQ